MITKKTPPSCFAHEPVVQTLPGFALQQQAGHTVELRIRRHKCRPGESLTASEGRRSGKSIFRTEG